MHATDSQSSGKKESTVAVAAHERLYPDDTGSVCLAYKVYGE
jgi:hypothetical protein